MGLVVVIVSDEVGEKTCGGRCGGYNVCGHLENQTAFSLVMEILRCCALVLHVCDRLDGFWDVDLVIRRLKSTFFLLSAGRFVGYASDVSYCSPILILNLPLAFLHAYLMFDFYRGSTFSSLNLSLGGHLLTLMSTFVCALACYRDLGNILSSCLLLENKK